MSEIFYGLAFDLSAIVQRAIPKTAQSWYFVKVTAPLMDRYFAAYQRNKGKSQP